MPVCPSPTGIRSAWHMLFLHSCWLQSARQGLDRRALSSWISSRPHTFPWSRSPHQRLDVLNTLLSAACVLIWELRDFVICKLRREKAELHLTGCPIPMSESITILKAANVFLFCFVFMNYGRFSLSGLKQQRWPCGVVLLTFLCDPLGTTLRLSRPDRSKNNIDYTLPVIEIWQRTQTRPCSGTFFFLKRATSFLKFLQTPHWAGVHWVTRWSTDRVPSRAHQKDSKVLFFWVLTTASRF